MAKPSAFAMKLQRQAEAKATLKGEMARRFALQQGQDIACIALHVAFGFGPERIKRFVDAYAQVFNEYASKALEDAKDDDEIIHTKYVMDKLLTECFGEELCPFDERYKWCFEVIDREQPKGTDNYKKKAKR